MSCLDCGVASNAVQHTGLFLLPKIRGIRFQPGNVSQFRFASSSEKRQLGIRLFGMHLNKWHPSRQSKHKMMSHINTQSKAIWWALILRISLCSQLKIIQKKRCVQEQCGHGASAQKCCLTTWLKYTITLNTQNKNIKVIYSWYVPFQVIGQGNTIFTLKNSAKKRLYLQTCIN